MRMQMLLMLTQNICCWIRPALCPGQAVRELFQHKVCSPRLRLWERQCHLCGKSQLPGNSRKSLLQRSRSAIWMSWTYTASGRKHPGNINGGQHTATEEKADRDSACRDA